MLHGQSTSYVVFSSSSATPNMPFPDTNHFSLLIKTPDGRVFLETHSPIYRQAYDFLIAIAEPLCRPEDVHEYVITQYSLYAAASVGLRTDKIIETLEKFCKTALPQAVVRDIRACTQRYGRVKLVLRNARYFIESTDPEALQTLLRDPVIRDARVTADEEPTSMPGTDPRQAALRVRCVESRAWKYCKVTVSAISYCRLPALKPPRLRAAANTRRRRP